MLTSGYTTYKNKCPIQDNHELHLSSQGGVGASWAPFLTHDRMLAGPVLCRWSQLQWVWEHKATSSSMLVFYTLPYFLQLVYSVYPFYNGPWAWRGHMSQLWMDIQPSLCVVMSLYSTAYDLPSHRVLVGLMILVMSSLLSSGHILPGGW